MAGSTVHPIVHGILKDILVDEHGDFFALPYSSQSGVLVAHHAVVITLPDNGPGGHCKGDN
jgi:hypothetical protein